MDKSERNLKMPALTSAFETADQIGELVAYKLGASKTVYQGGLLVVDDTTGYVEAASDTSGKTFIGVAYESGANPGSAGLSGVRVRKRGVFGYDCTNATASWVGKAVYVVDDHTVALGATTTNDVLVGYVVAVESTSKVRARIDNAVR
jgi:predicted RecA/RadA family phage recombinase